MSTVKPLWTPSEERIRGTRMYEFMTRIGGSDGIGAEWEALRAWAIERPGRFWAEILAYAEISPRTPALATCQGSGMLGTEWFPGMTLNYAEHLLRFSGSDIAIHAETEEGEPRDLSWDAMRSLVARFAQALRDRGVGKGDRVGGFMPNIPETVVAMLAVASIGAIWSSCSPDFGINGVLDRFGQIEPSVLVVVDGYKYGGKRIDCLERTRKIAEALPSLRSVVVVSFLDEAPDISSVPNSCHWGECLGDGAAPALTFEAVPFDHPLFIMYSSGTTGIPKCIVHGHGGTLLQHMKELMLHCDIRRGEKVFYFTTCGWMMWNWVVSSLGVGATLVLYEGSPMYPRSGRLWELAEQAGLSLFGTSPKYIAACQKGGVLPGEQYDLSKLRCICSTGSPLSDEQFVWVYEHIKKDVQLSSISGGTDIISCFMLGNPVLPVYAGEIQSRGLGMDVRCWSDEGSALVGEKGELVCCSAFPSQPVSFWNDPDGSKYREAYFDHFDGVWRHGDLIEVTERGGVIVYGRSDATLNPGGVRIGTAEIYRIVEALDEVVDSVVVAKRVPGDVEVCLFVVLREGVVLDAALEDRIRREVAIGATKRHVPRHIRQVTGVPHTISGKKVELAVTKMIHGEAIKNRDALANPEALEQFAGLV